jgi:hypothetical protein
MRTHAEAFWNAHDEAEIALTKAAEVAPSDVPVAQAFIAIADQWRHLAVAVLNAQAVEQST